MIKDDSFWSTDRLLPPHRRGGGGVPLSRLAEPLLEQEPVQRAEFGSYSTLHSAELIAQSAGGASFKGFLRDAEKLREKTAAEGSYRRFFSYTPCYRDLDAGQMNTYLSFREDVRCRRRRPVDYSYLALYCYELLNLGDREEPSRSLDTLLWIWGSYREEFAVLDKLMSDWVLDFCVEWSLPFPLKELDGLLPKALQLYSPILTGLYVFDYLLSGSLRPDREQTEFVMRALCDYRYRNVRLYRENALYATAMDGFLVHLFAEGFLTLPDQREEFCSLKIPTPLTVKRSTYPGAVIDPIRRRTVCLNYSPLLGDLNVKGRFTSLIKYVDNRVRKHLGMKAKFALLNNSPVHLSFIDARFEAYFSSSARKKEEALAAGTPPSPPRKPQVDLQAAARIESASWKTTDALTKDLYMQEGEMVAVGEKPRVKEEAAREYVYEENTEEDVTELAASLDTVERDFCLRLLYFDAQKAKAYALSRGQFFENLLRRVNQKALDLMGDVLLLPTGEIPEDYREPLKFLFPREEYLSEEE